MMDEWTRSHGIFCSGALSCKGHALILRRCCLIFKFAVDKPRRCCIGGLLTMFLTLTSIVKQYSMIYSKIKLFVHEVDPVRIFSTRKRQLIMACKYTKTRIVVFYNPILVRIAMRVEQNRFL
jgi:hypothetical protein